ncbi:MAG: hypothetical protein IKN12_11475, partial [Selenomonadaceae bacterium]|nr:hypothetical protein [Selenomonadaceae bacterium]
KPHKGRRPLTPPKGAALWTPSYDICPFSAKFDNLVLVQKPVIKVFSFSFSLLLSFSLSFLQKRKRKRK